MASSDGCGLSKKLSEMCRRVSAAAYGLGNDVRLHFKSRQSWMRHVQEPHDGMYVREGAKAAGRAYM